MRHISTEIYPEFEQLNFIIENFGTYHVVSTSFINNKFSGIWNVNSGYNPSDGTCVKITTSSQLYSKLITFGKQLLTRIHHDKAIEISNLCDIHKIKICRYQ